MVDRLERLINLVIALRETRKPLTVETISERVAGYQGERDDAWRRMFERDKADLRDMGVPIRTEPLGRFDDAIGYRIHASDYDLSDLSFTPAELTGLALSVELTGLGDDAAPGLDKLAVDAGDRPTAAWPHRLPLAIGLDAPNRSRVVDALRDRRRIRFDYATPGGQGAERRHVEPHALLHHRGRWYVTGHDRGRDAGRTFRLDRIVGRVSLVGEAGAFDLPDRAPRPADVIPGAGDEVLDAVVAASPEVAWAVARRSRGGSRSVDADGHVGGDADGDGVGDGPAPDTGDMSPPDGWRTFTVRVTDADRFVAWVLELGAEAVVVSPPALRDAVIGRLRAVVA